MATVALLLATLWAAERMLEGWDILCLLVPLTILWLTIRQSRRRRDVKQELAGNHPEGRN